MLGILVMSAKKLAAKLAVAMISESFMEWAFFKIAESIVKSTATPHDDEWLAKIKEEFEK
ncbi:MAG: hypothetical protein ACRDC4_00565 [Plesiomonas sp.]